MAEYTPVSKINYDLFKQNYDPNLPYNQQSQTIQQKYNEDLFNKYSGIASEEPKLGFFEKLGSGLESLFSAYGAEPDYVNPNLAEMLAQQNYQNTLAYSPMFDNRNRFKEDIIPERMINAPMDLESTMAGSILDKGITNRSLIGDLPNLNYKDYLSNLFNRNKTTQPDFINAPQDDYASLYYNQLPYSGVGDMGYTTPRTIADQNKVLGQTFTEKKPSGLATLENLMPGSLFGNLLSGIFGKDSPEVRATKDFYAKNYGVNSAGSVASGIMQGYNPVSGGFLNMITGGKYGEPMQVGLANAARRRIENIVNRKAPQTEASRAKIAELQRIAERDTINRARTRASDVYSRAEANKALGPGGGFSTSGSKRDSGFTSRSSSPSGRGRRDY